MVKHSLLSGLLVLVLLFAGTISAMADKPAPPSDPVVFNAAGPSPDELYLGMTPEQRELALKKEAASASYGVTTLNYYKWLDVPVREQETDYWCGPASGKSILDYLGKVYTQSYLAGPYNPSQGQYGMETTQADGTIVWKYARTLNDLDGDAVPPDWVWEYLNVNGNQQTLIDKLKWDLDRNLPQVNRSRMHPDESHYLKGFVTNYGHYIALCGYDYRPDYGMDNICYTNSYEDPNNGSDTSLGRWWWPTGKVTYCNVVWDGGWIIW
ncbi:MAG: hypothetical protein HPY69_21325 [Armatimonadetes bacterium]|nr:hypothetical protein [Armatimonadota bacterium]